MFTNSVFGMIRAAVLIAVVQESPGAGGFDETGMITFSFLTQGMLAYAGVFGGEDEIGQRVRTGDVVTDFYRPSDFQVWWLASDIGRGMFQLVGRTVPIVAIGALVYGLQWPESPVAVVLFVVSMLGGLVIGFGIRYLVSLSAFWILDTRGSTQLAVTLTIFGSGTIAPLSLFPDWLEPIVRALPFAGMVQTPADIWLGAVTGVDAVARVLMQLGWAAALFVIGRYVTTLATRRVVIQGG